MEEKFNTKKLAIKSQDNPFLESQYQLKDKLADKDHPYNISAFPKVQTIPTELLPFYKKAKIA